MKVILQQEVKGLGKKGDIVDVADGHARNYLLPRKIAILATSANVNIAKQHQEAEQIRARRQAEEARALAAQLGKVGVTVKVRTGENGKMFGSVTAKDIAEALAAQHGIEIDRRKIDLREPLKTLGEFPVVLRLHPDVAATIWVFVVAG